MSSVRVCDKLTFKGSVDTVVEFFHYAVNSILYQRGIYSAETFKSVPKYEISILLTQNPDLIKYLKEISSQMSQFMMKKCLKQIDVIFKRLDNAETIEKWEFRVECVDKKLDENGEVEVDMKAVRGNIREIIRQITASVSFLPLIEHEVSFEILLHIKKDTEISEQLWADSTNHLMTKAEKVEFKNFNTNIHGIKTQVCYKINED